MTLNAARGWTRVWCRRLALAAWHWGCQRPGCPGCQSVPVPADPVLPPVPQLPPPQPVAPPRPPRIGLALGGGAARGFAHIGVIQVLEEQGIRPVLVVGTSAGSLVAALYASGKSGVELGSLATRAWTSRR